MYGVSTLCSVGVTCRGAFPVFPNKQKEFHSSVLMFFVNSTLIRDITSL